MEFWQFCWSTVTECNREEDFEEFYNRNKEKYLKVLSYQYDGDSYCRTKVELYQKVGSGYQKLTNALNQVNGSTTHNMGTFDIASVNGKNDITFMLSSLLQEGTYRLVLKVFSSNEEQLIEVPYNFLIDN